MTPATPPPDGVRALASRVVMASFPGPQPPAWLLHRLAAGLGSVCLFGSNLTGSDAQARALTDALHTAGPTALVAVDEEGGDVTRLDARRGSPLPGAAAAGAAGSPALTEELHRALGARLAACGVDLDLAPVADVNSDPANPVIGVRSFGADGATVAAHVAAAVRGLQTAGLAACVKHFPGHGDTRDDSHAALPRLDVPVPVLDRRELLPFRAAVAAGVEAVMTGHLLVPALDPAGPASTSAPVTALLRDGLGFRGLVVTDALDMAGVSGPAAHGSLPAAAVAALAAGADLLCLGAEQGDHEVEAVVDAVCAAVRDGRLAAARLRRAAGRVAAAGERARRRRAAAGAPPSRDPAVAPGASSVPGTAGDAARRVARAALTVDGVLPDVAGAAVLRLLTEPNVAVGAVPWGLGPALSAMLPGVTCIDVTPADDPAAVVDRVAGRTVVAAVRDAHRHRRVLDLLAALASRTDLVTVELGWPGGRLPGVAVVRTLGASAVSAQVAAELLASRGVAP